MSRRNYLILLVAVMAAVALACLVAPGADARTRCTEDSRCFVWSQMGNLQRGVYVSGRKRIRVVDPCAFAHLDFTGRIDWKRTRRLRGDAFARANGCNPRLYAPSPR